MTDSKEKECEFVRHPTSPFMPDLWKAQADLLSSAQRDSNSQNAAFGRGFFQCAKCALLLQVYRVDTWEEYPCSSCKSPLFNPYSSKHRASDGALRVFVQCTCCNNFLQAHTDAKKKQDSYICEGCNRQIADPYFGNLCEPRKRLHGFQNDLKPVECERLPAVQSSRPRTLPKAAQSEPPLPSNQGMPEPTSGE